MEGSRTIDLTKETGTPVVENLVIAGWTGRDQAAMEAHIVELEALGIPRPKTTPIFYRVAASLLTTAPAIQVPGNDSSGEVEAVVVALPDGLYLGVGSDHTDRKVETVNITVSKQVCAKPLGPELWRFDDVADHWDDLILRSFAIRGGERIAYQEGAAVSMRHPEDLMSRYLGADNRLSQGWAMFCGTQPVIGEIAPADRFEIEIEDPVRGRKLTHGYDILVLPNEG